jgi:hypothetical protein
VTPAEQMAAIRKRVAAEIVATEQRMQDLLRLQISGQRVRIMYVQTLTETLGALEELDQRQLLTQQELEQLEIGRANLGRLEADINGGIAQRSAAAVLN